MDKYLNKTNTNFNEEINGESSYDRDDEEAPRKRHRNFCETWKNDGQLNSWLKKTDLGAFCTICNFTLKASSGKADLLRHSDSKKHNQNAQAIAIQPTIKALFKPNATRKVSKAELQLCAFIVEHNLPFATADHLTKCVKSCFDDSKIALEVSCGKTKTKCLIKNALGQHQFENLIKLLKTNKFSLCIDESTDVSCTKLLSLVVRVCQDFMVQDYFLGLISVEACDAINLYTSIKNFFINNRIPYVKNMIGFAADGANNMTGSKNSVAQLFKTEIPFLFISKCICHSLALCTSYACLQLPACVETLVRDLYNYISNSPNRSEKFKHIMELLEYKPKKLLHPSLTRWLSLEAVVCRVLELYEPLKIYFAFAVNVDHIDTAQIILNNFNSINELYLCFLKYVLQIINKVNRLFQSENLQIHNMYTEMRRLFLIILQNFIKPEYIFQDIVQIDFKKNYHFLNNKEIYLGVYVKEKVASLTLLPEEFKQFTQRCIFFYIELCDQIKKRFDFNDQILKNLTFISPKNIIKRKTSSLEVIYRSFPNLIKSCNAQAIDNEFRELRIFDFDVLFDTNEEITAEVFWKSLSKVKHADNTFVFNALSKFVASLMCLPNSSANVERIFSKINLNKTKTRNRIKTETLTGILLSQDYLKYNNFSCYNIEPQTDLINKLNSELYKNL